MSTNMEEPDIIKHNIALLTEGDDTILICGEHNTTARWGDLSQIAQMTVLAGLDYDGCCLNDKVTTS